MTEHRGYFCPRCGFRYVAHACKEDHLPCQHDFRDAFYTYRWDYSEGYKKFIVANNRHGIFFKVRYVTQEKLDVAIKKYCEWLRWMMENDQIWLIIGDKEPIQVFLEACESAGGEGRTWPPKWRFEELQKVRI